MIGEEKPKTSFAASALKRVKWFTSNKYNEEGKVFTMAELNRQIKVLAEQKNIEELELFTKETSLMCMRPLLTDGMPKDGIVAYFRYIMTSPEVCRSYKKLNIPLLVSRILEKEIPSDTTKANEAGKGRALDKEILQCLKFIQKWIDIAPKEVPKLLISSLVAFSELPTQQTTKKDCIHISEKKLAIGAIRRLSTNNPELCAWSGGINVLLNAIIDPQLQELSSDIVCTILYLINEPNTRSKTHSYLDLSRIFWIFNDIDYNPDKKDKQAPQTSKARMQIQLDLGKNAIIKIFKSWVGLVYLGSQIAVLKSFVESLRQKIRPQVRTAIYEVLESLLMIGSNTCSRQREAINKLRIANLLNCYLITLVQLLIDCDLFKILVELSGLEDPQITVPAQKFLKQLTILMFNSLPNSSKYIDFLISSVTNQHEGTVSLSLKSCSSFVINKIGNYVFDKKPKQQSIKLLSELQNLYKPSTLYIPLTQASLNQTNYVMNLIPDGDTDTKLKCIYETTAILRESKQKYQRWKWEAIEEILKHPYDNKTKNLLETENHKENKLIKYLLRFYSPTKRLFSNQSWHIDNFRYVKVGQLLVKNILNLPAFMKMLNDPSPSQFEITVSFIDELKQALRYIMEDTAAKKRVTPSFYQGLERQLIVWIGLFSESKKGYQQLVVHNQFFELLQDCIEKPCCEYILSTLLMYFEYSKQNQRKSTSKDVRDPREIGSRDLLEKCLIRGSKQLTLQALEVLRMLYKTEVAGFNNWGFKMYSRLLKNKELKDPQLLATIMESIEEIFEEEQHVSDFIEYLSFEDLARIKDSLSSKFLINLLSTEKGFVNITQHLGEWLDQEYERWLTDKNLQYNDHMEDSLNEAFNFAEPTYNGYILREPNNELDLLYIYKLPWTLKIGSTIYPMFCRWRRNVFYLEAEVGEKITGRQEMVLMIGTMEIDQHINLDSQATPSKKIDFTLVDDKIAKGTKKPNGTVQYTENCVTFTFQDRPDRIDRAADVHILIKVRVELRIHKTFDNAELPKHLMGELAKTSPGIAYLRSKKAMEYFVENIERGESPLRVRASLWALGQLGSSNLGMELIKQYGVIDILIRMSYSHTYISLRGSCRYILNMLCASAEGRKEIVRQGWLTNRNSNIGWICVPAVSTKFFKIDKTEDNYWAANGQYWNQYHSQLEPLNEKQKKLLSNIAMLSNTLSQKSALGQIKQMKKANPELTLSVKLLRNVLMMMTFYKFRAEVRRFIYSIFDEQIRSTQFLNEALNSKLYII